MRIWRIALVVLGVALLVVGGLVLLQDVAPKRYGGILLWFAGALVIHDGIIAGLVIAVNLTLRKAGRRVPFGVLVIIQGAIVVGAIMALIVFPQIVKQGIGTLNPTILPLDYAANLVLFYGVLAAATAVTIAVYLRARPQSRRRRTNNDAINRARD
ncbi:hypothetical protein [Marisediminicola antarctica]|uniref:hypothetical protein n=1 Tax=Marisediminicola antarctica TaxID=674079 RepID=UPI001379D11E|nr:hypothetical protein [Marisediminicola antarctica]